MEKPNADRKWIGLILLLLIAEVVWLFMDLQWIKIPYLSKKHSASQSVEAGHIISSKKDLKRRGANSLVWEDTQPKDTLFYYDSVLTLSQSTAKLYLKDQTELELSENTLVTLEEPTDNTKSEIRLRFSRGDLKARNPSFKTSVVSDDWVVNLDKGSDIVLRKDQDSYEFEVVSGSATLQTKDGSQSLTQDKVIKLNDDQKIETIKKSENLQWKEDKPVRIYTLNETAEIPLEWQGEAQDIVINKSGAEEKNQNLKNDRTTASVKLDYGSYKIRLKNQNGISEAKTVEVWKAPHIYLKKPLPRDRLKTGEPHEFIWTTDKGVKIYRVQFSGKDAPSREEGAEQNFTSLKFDKEQDLQWQVQGVDEEGFVIPPLYNNEIYLRDEPLQAPKLKAPDVKKESAPSGAYHKWQWIFETLMPKAHAKQEAKKDAKRDSYEVNFSWEPVAGADQYVLEVSSTPDFRKPELIKTLSSTSFTWKKVQYKKYYWRVAAGSAKGRMGLFSEAMELQMEEIKSVVAAEPVVEKPVEVETPAVSEPPTQVAETPAVEKEIELPQIPSGFGFALAPSYKYSKTTGEQDTIIDLQGMVPLGLQLSYKSGWINKHNYHFNLWTSTQTWKPKPKDDYPFQDDLKVRESIVTFDRGSVNEKSRWGFVLHENFTPEREDEQSLKIKSRLALGLRTSRLFDVGDRWQNKLGLSVLTSSKTYEVMFDAQTKMYLSNSDSKMRWFWGLGANAVYQSHKDGGGLQSDLIFLLGLEQF